MALKGTISEFAVADIFQLVVSQKKTGVLSLRDKNQVVELHLQEGCILACQDDSRPRDKKLGQLLVRGGFISEEECSHALALQDTKGRRLGELIVAQGLLELATVRSLAEVQVFETVFEVFSWREGEYEFRNQGLVNGQTGLRLLGEEVLLEGVRYLDEMPALKSLYPDREATLKARRHGVSHGMLEELSPGARRVWELIEEGGAELATVLIKAHLHILDGLRAVSELESADLVSIRSSAATSLGRVNVSASLGRLIGAAGALVALLGLAHFLDSDQFLTNLRQFTSKRMIDVESDDQRAYRYWKEFMKEEERAEMKFLMRREVKEPEGLEELNEEFVPSVW